MKKKFLTGLGCLALAVAGTFGLVGCGEKPATPDVRFDAVQGYYMGQDLNVQGTKWTKQTQTEDGVEAIYEINEGQTINYNANALASEAECAHLIAITLTGKNGDVKGATLKIADSKDELASAQEEEYKQRTDKQGHEIVEKDYIIFLTLTEGAEHKNAEKTFYLSIDWDGEGNKFQEVVYKFVIDAGSLTLGQQSA